jgi:hypothetical protein
MEQKHVESIDGMPEPADIFEPHMPGVELFSDMDGLFEMARRLSATGEYPRGEGEPSAEVAAKLAEMKGRRSVVILTPGRILMPVPAPEPDSVPEEMQKGVRELLPPDTPQVISVISYTYVKALIEDKAKAIPFLGFLVGFASIGHTVVVFEGHPSAFESGIRGTNVLMVDSGMLPFIQKDWKETAFRVMSPDAKVLEHDRATYQLKQHFQPGVKRAPLVLSPEERVDWYAGTLFRLLLTGTRTSLELTSGETLPDLAELATSEVQRAEIASLPFRHDQLDTDKVIDKILVVAGWRPFSLFKKTWEVKVPFATPDGRPTGTGVVAVSLRRVEGGRRRLLIER